MLLSVSLKRTCRLQKKQITIYTTVIVATQPLYTHHTRKQWIKYFLELKTTAHPQNYSGIGPQHPLY